MHFNPIAPIFSERVSKFDGRCNIGYGSIVNARRNEFPLSYTSDHIRIGIYSDVREEEERLVKDILCAMPFTMQRVSREWGTDLDHRGLQ